jgi:hypothetical protein
VPSFNLLFPTMYLEQVFLPLRTQFPLTMIVSSRSNFPAHVLWKTRVSHNIGKDSLCWEEEDVFSG